MMAAPARRRDRITAAYRSGPLSGRDFRLLAGGQLASTVGDYCYAIALPWLVLSPHRGPGGAALLGVVLACYGVPRTVLIPVGGMLADKLGPRRLMLAADAGRCVLVAVLAVLAARRMSSVEVLGPVAALIGAGEGLFVPASFALVPTLVKPDQLQAGNALSAAMTQAGSLAGPVLGGILVATAGSTPAFAVDAATFALSAISLALISTRSPAAAADGGAPEETGPGVWTLLRTSRLLQVFLVVGIAANLASGGTTDVALPALAHARFGAGGYGALLACFGTGAMLGTLYAARGRKLARPTVVACGAYFVMAAATALLPFLWGLPGAAAASLVWGVTNGFGNVVFITLLQQWAPGRLLGRVMGLIMLASFGSFPLSVAVAGLLVRHLGPSPIFPIAAGLVTVAIIGALSQREIRTFGAAAPDRAEAVEVA